MKLREITNRMDRLSREYERTLPDETRRQEIADELSVLALILDRMMSGER